MEETNTVIDFSRILKSGDYAASADQKVFNYYARNYISLRKCFELFITNCLGYVDEAYWDANQFRNWLRTLGYSNNKERIK